MTGTRIRWYDEPEKSVIRITGMLGASGLALFRIFDPDFLCTEWQLTTDLPGMIQERCYADGPDELKAEAERWLEEFVSSLGAVFPELRRQRDIADRIDQIIGWAKDGAGHDWYRMDREKVDRMRDDILSYAFGTQAPSAPQTEG